MRHLGPFVLAITVVVFCSAAANAQGIANSLQELRLLVRAGDTVRVTDSTGRIRTAKIGELTPQALVLGDGANRVSLDEKDITTITQRRSDPLGNGALWGMGIGGGLVGLAFAATGDGGEGAGVVVGATIAWAAIGAGLGVGIDALIRRHMVVFERPGDAGPRVRVSPLVSPQAAGARVALTF
jgi:hypothetical protein